MTTIAVLCKDNKDAGHLFANWSMNFERTG